MDAVSDAVPDFVPRRFLIENRSLVHFQIGNGRRERCRLGFSTSPFLFENLSLSDFQIGNGRRERCRLGFSTSSFPALQWAAQKICKKWFKNGNYYLQSKDLKDPEQSRLSHLKVAGPLGRKDPEARCGTSKCLVQCNRNRSIVGIAFERIAERIAVMHLLFGKKAYIF